MSDNLTPTSTPDYLHAQITLLQALLLYLISLLFTLNAWISVLGSMDHGVISYSIITFSLMCADWRSMIWICRRVGVMIPDKMRNEASVLWLICMYSVNDLGLCNVN
jgi:hypothetical protein